MREARQAKMLVSRAGRILDLLARRQREVSRRDKRIEEIRRPADARIASIDAQLLEAFTLFFRQCDRSWKALAGIADSFTAWGMRIWRERVDAKIGYDAKKTAAIIAELRDLKLDDCITTVEVIDVEALLRHADEVMRIDGIHYSPADMTFGAKPVKGKGIAERMSVLRRRLAQRRGRSANSGQDVAA
jgi:hypothetical protein